MDLYHANAVKVGIVLTIVGTVFLTFAPMVLKAHILAWAHSWF